MLEMFFKRGRRISDEPAAAEVERDVRALLHGRKEGEVMVKNENPHVVRGSHFVEDKTH